MQMLTMFVLTGCVSKKKYGELETAMNSEVAQLSSELQNTKDSLAGTQGSLEEQTDRANRLEREKAELLKDQSKLEASVAEMERALKELNLRKAAADARIAQFKDLVARFKKLIDAGKLQVKIVDGRMVVQLATDVLFSSGSAKLSEDGKQAIVEVSEILRDIENRDYQVEGHTDDVPISTAQYPSNWELAAGRALTVVKTMVGSGMDADRISAASYGEHRPVASNETDEGKAQNRRIEIVVVPDLSTLPGFEELQEASTD